MHPEWQDDTGKIGREQLTNPMDELVIYCWPLISKSMKTKYRSDRRTLVSYSDPNIDQLFVLEFQNSQKPIGQKFCSFYVMAINNWNYLKKLLLLT